MRNRLLLALSILAGWALWLPAQQTTLSPSIPAPDLGVNNGLVTVEGCLRRSKGIYNLGSTTGEVYRIAGDRNFIRRHVGQEVRVTGIPIPTESPINDASTPKAQAGETNEGSGAAASAPSLSVSKIEMLATACSH
jgi:hypothetical protein